LFHGHYSAKAALWQPEKRQPQGKIFSKNRKKAVAFFFVFC
jgi:hypothetical protein